MEDHTHGVRDVGTAHTSPVAGLTRSALEEHEVPSDNHTWHTEVLEPRVSDDHTPSRDCTGGSHPFLLPQASNLETTYDRRHDRFTEIQYAHSSLRMELLHQVDNLEYNIGYIQESVDALVSFAMKTSSKGLRSRLKAAQEALQADVASFRTQKQTVVEKMTSLRESDIGLNDAEVGLDIVSRAILATLHRTRIVSQTSEAQSDISLALTRDSTSDEARVPVAPLSVELQAYYDAFNDVNFMQERLYELEAEREEQLVRRDLLVDQERILEQSDEAFNASWEQQLQTARDDLERALKAHEAARLACDESGIAIPTPHKHDASSSLAGNSPPRQRTFGGEDSLPGFAPPRWMHGASPSSLIPTGPVLAGSGISSASDPANDNPAMKERVSHWLETNVTSAPLILHRTRGASEPGALLSDYYKGTSIRAAISMDSMRPSVCLDTTDCQTVSDLPVSSTMTSVSMTQQSQCCPSAQPSRGPADDSIETRRATDVDLAPANDQLNVIIAPADLGHNRAASTPFEDSALGSSLCISSAPGTQRHVIDAEFKKQLWPLTFFRPGRVFLTLWTPPELLERQNRPGDNGPNTYAFTRVRRFIVVHQAERSCGALAISTHSGNGDTQKRKYNHDFVYTGSRPPGTTSRFAGKLQKGIHIDTFDSRQALHATSRVSYARVYTIGYETRVKSYGLVNPASLERLFQRLEIFGKAITANQRDSDVIAQAMQSPTTQTLEALEFTAKQASVILEIIDRGTSSETAIKSVAKVSAESELHSVELASQVSDLVAAGVGYLAAIARVRNTQAASISPQHEGFGQPKTVAEYDVLDEDDEIGADNELGYAEKIAPCVRHHSI